MYKLYYDTDELVPIEQNFDIDQRLIDKLFEDKKYLLD